MQDLGLDLAHIAGFFIEDQGHPFVLIRVPPEAADGWAESLDVPVRRCYLSDDRLAQNVTRTNRSRTEVVRAHLPDPGSTMSGDFGEIIAALFLASQEHPSVVCDPKKWRLKHDRTKPAPYSDVVQFLLPQWPAPSLEDRLICAEVKAKATDGDSTPVASALAGCQKDRQGRLIKTLEWLRERALGEDLGTVDLDRIERFINATDHPPATHDFRAVAVVCSSLADGEIEGLELPSDGVCALVVISIPDLKDNYEALYEAVVSRAEDEGAEA